MRISKSYWDWSEKFKVAVWPVGPVEYAVGYKELKTWKSRS